MRFDDEFLRELRARIDISELISPYVNLKRQGRLMKGLCPFHNEKSPSFTVYTENQSFFCFGCGAGGDAVTFIRKIENLDYYDAVKLLADRAGMQMPQDGFDDSLSKRRRRILEANKAAARFYHERLFSPEGKVCLDYYLGRGYTIATIKHFGLGYAPDGWHTLRNALTAQGFSNEELFEANLLMLSTKNGKNNYYDSFRGRAMIPIIDVRGSVVGFGGRVLDNSKPKYINTSDTLVFKKGQGVFGLNYAKNDSGRKLILVEGYMDTIALHQAGFTNTVACLGTALPREQVSLVCRYADEIILCYDSDEAGQKATARAIRAFSETGVKIRVLKLVGGKDPDEIIKEFGRERFKSLLDGAANDTEYRLLAEREKFDVSTDDGKLNFLNAAVTVLAGIDNEIERDIYVGRLADEFNIGKAALVSRLKSIRRMQYKKRQNSEFREAQSAARAFDDTVNPEKSRNLRAARAEEILLATLMASPDFLSKLRPDLTEESFVTAFNRRVFKQIAEMIDEGAAIDLTGFSSVFQPDEMGHISRLINFGSEISNTVAECNDCIKVLKEEKAKTDVVDVGSMTDDEFRELFKNRAKKKEN